MPGYRNHRSFPPPLYVCWRSFEKRFNRRDPGQQALKIAASKSTAFKDGLSGPLTIVLVILRYKCGGSDEGNNRGDAAQMLNTNEPLHIVVVGASAVNEEVGGGGGRGRDRVLRKR